jgi:hypothetical protein
MLYTIVNKGDLRVTHKDIELDDFDFKADTKYLIPTEECGVHMVGDLYSVDNHSFSSYIVSVEEYRATHKGLFEASDITLLRHYENAPTLTDEALLALKEYRATLRSNYQSYTPTENPVWPQPPT